jgi:hypothetical protein
MSDPNNYIVGWICTITTEYVTARVVLDGGLEHPGSDYVSVYGHNNYTLGRIGQHKAVLLFSPKVKIGRILL